MDNNLQYDLWHSFFNPQLLNRQKRSKKKVPAPLTADMLNELNKNHMGGFDNYGQEELYIDDQWDDVKADFKPKVCEISNPTN